MVLSGDPPIFNTGDTEDQYLEEEAVSLWRREVPYSLPTPTSSSSTEQLPQKAGPLPPPHCCQDNFGDDTGNLILPPPPPPWPSKRMGSRLRWTLCHVLIAKGLGANSKAGLSRGRSTRTFSH